MRRKYLTWGEIKCLLKTASENSSSVRDHCMVSLAFYHGLRVSELISLKIEDYDPISQKIHIHRLKGGLSTSQPLLPEECILIKEWLSERDNLSARNLPWLFLSRQGRPLTRQRFYQVIKKYGEMAGINVKIHPHMLRHACGYNLADRGNDTRLIQDYLGHRNIRHTVIYTATNSARFKNIWGKDIPHCD